MKNDKCDFGCERPAVKIFKNGKKCCSENVNSCPSKRLKDSESKKGKNPWEGRQHPRGMTGKKSWNSGKTNIELMGEERAKLVSEKIKNNSQVETLWKRTPDHVKERIRKEASDRAYKRHAEGWQGAIGRCKKIKYFSKIAGDMLLDGGWELLVAKFLDNLNVHWQRNKKRFEYIDNDSKKRFYTPDFYLIDENCYIEVKGYETDLDRCKWKQFPEKIEIWKKEKIKEIKNYFKINNII